MTNSPNREEKVLLTGVTGYVGGRLLPLLLDLGFTVRCAARNPENLSRINHQRAEVIRTNLLEFDSLESAFVGVDTAYYLVHSLGAASSFEENELRCAHNFVRAAKIAGVKKIIYLGGLGAEQELSPHLRTRQEVGRILRESGVPTIEFRASIIIGSGSLSFEMVRSLVDRLPAMIIPRWVTAKAQPIAIEDVLDYLIAALQISVSDSRIYEIGGPDVVSYMDIMHEYGRVRGLRRLMLPVPFLTPYLSSLWLGLVTPLYARVGRKLIDSIRHDTVVTDQRALNEFSIRPRGFKEAISRALKNEDREFAETKWSNSLSSAGERLSWGGTKIGSRLVDSRSAVVKCAPEFAFAPIAKIGGDAGWYYANWAWQLRGFLDLLVGGVGVRRGRSNPNRLAVGDAIDFWRIEAVKPNCLLRLRAEMKLPGRAWLQFEVDQQNGGSIIRQTAIFDPIGVFGLLYWYGLFPMHSLIFSGMLSRIAEQATKKAQLQE